MSSSCRAAVSIAALLGELLCVAAAPVAAQTWQIDYDPSLGTKPSAQGWTHDVADPLPDDELSEGNYLVALGALSQGDTGGSNTDAGNTQWYEAAPPSFDFQADLIVVDLRLKILASTLTAPGQPTPSAGFGVFVRDDSSQSVSLFVGAAGLFLQGMVGAGGSSLLVPFDSTLAYADYQLRVDRYGASVLVDGTVLATLASEDLHTGFLPRVVYPGDVSTTELSSSQLQSFRLSRFVPPAAQVHSYETITEYSTTDSTSVKSRTVSCPPGRKALGGGVETIGAAGSVGLLDSRPSGGSPATSWFGSARELVGTSDTWQIRVDVICGEISGYENISFAEPHSTDAVQGSELDCDDFGKVVIGGGAGVAGANLRQTLISSLPFFPIADFEFDWGVGVKDYGTAVSSSAWGVEIDTIPPVRAPRRGLT